MFGESQIVPKRPAVATRYHSDYIKNLICGFLLVDAFAGGGIINVRYSRLQISDCGE